MKTYNGQLVEVEWEGGSRVDSQVIVDHNKIFYPLAVRNDLYNHSPDGFAWGYGGSGPHQLALAILADAIGDDFALAHKHQFCVDFVSGWPDKWEITDEQIKKWAQEKEFKL